MKAWPIKYENPDNDIKTWTNTVNKKIPINDMKTLTIRYKNPNNDMKTLTVIYKKNPRNYLKPPTMVANLIKFALKDEK